MSTHRWKHAIQGSPANESPLPAWPIQPGRTRRGGRGDATPRCSGQLALAICALALALAGCVSYTAQPQDPLTILRDLDAQVLPTFASRGRPPTGVKATDGSKAEPEARRGFTALQAAGWAVTHNPSLVALRADLGIADAELVRAGLLPDPVVGFDAMDALAVEWTAGTPHRRDFLSGLGISWSVPRPGELGARVGGARARMDGVRRSILTREWRLVRSVHLAFMAVLAARARLDLNSRVLATASRTATFFAQAQKVRGATAIQTNLALIEQSSLQQDRIRLEGELARTRQELNALLGLPPEAEVPLDDSENPFSVRPADASAARLIERAVAKRPDLQRLSAMYAEAEENLRLEIAKQWPAMSIGTVIAVALPIFGRLNRPAISAASARRLRIGRELRAAVHELRAEIYRAVTVLKNASKEVQMFEKTLIPQVRATLQLTDDAFRAREVTLVEILTAQRQSLDSQRNYLEARIHRARAKLLLDTIAGQVLAESPIPSVQPVAPKREKR